MITYQKGITKELLQKTTEQFIKLNEVLSNQEKELKELRNELFKEEVFREVNTIIDIEKHLLETQKSTMDFLKILCDENSNIGHSNSFLHSDKD